METDIQKQISKWLKKDPDYNSGLALLVQVCKNKTLVRNLSRKGTPKNLAKISWELRKAIGETGFSKPISAGIKKKIEASGTSASVAGEKLREISYPETIQTIIKNIGDLSSNRDKLHRQLKQIPEANTEDNIKKRKQVLDLIKETTDLLEHYYALKDRFFTEKIVPTEEELKFPQPKKEKAKAKKQNPVENMTEAELIKKRHNVRSNLTKKKNKLLYQSTSKKKEEKPMPAGAIRDNLENLIKNDEKLLTQIQKCLDAFNKAK